MKRIHLLLTGLFLLNVSMISFAQEDPYIWMEEVESEKSMKWVNDQNTVSSKKLSAVDGFDALKNQFLVSMNDKEKIVYPTVVKEWVYNFWKDENNVRGIWRRSPKKLYMMKLPKWETVLDLDKLSKEDNAKWVYHGIQWLAPDYKRCLISLSDGGTDEDIVREFDVEKKEFVKGGFELPSSKGGASWINKDEIIISRNFGEGSMSSSGYPLMVKSLKRGQKIEDAKLLMEGEKDIMGIWGSSSYLNGKYVVSLSKAYSFYSHDSYVLQDGKFVKLDMPKDANLASRTNEELLYKLNSDWEINDKKYNLGDVVSVNFASLLKGTHEVKMVYHPNKKSSVEGVSVTKNGVLLNIIQNVKSVLYMAKLVDGEWTKTKVRTPAFGRISIIDADRMESDYFYQYSNFITPPSLYFVSGGSITLMTKGKNKFNAENLVVNQYEVQSKDGTTLPYFIVHKKDIVYDGKNPTLVWAYGGFNISSKPRYNTRAGIGWLEKGGVYVVANIRGGGEFGPSWHQAAKKEKRQNAYDDFYAVCEDLMKRKITSQPHLGAFGWSNGGLMAGVVATQRPDLFNAVIIGAPLLDMKRFNKMLAGASWMGEYGNPDIPEEWAFISKYSPYHNVHKDKKYPEVMFVTSTKDDRVHPAHARKMAARMMEQGHPIYYYETVEGGHGASSTYEQAAFNQALMFSYLKLKLMK